MKWKLGDWAYFSHEGIIHKKMIIEASFVLNKDNKLRGTFILSPSWDSSYSKYKVDGAELYKTAKEIRKAEYAKIKEMLEKLD